MSQSHHSYLYSAKDSRLIDEQTIESFGISGFTLMEAAATGASSRIISEHPAGTKALAVCGKGNNGGDALAVSRLLAEEGFRVDIFFPLGSEKLSPDAGKNLELIHVLTKNGTPGTLAILEDFPKLDSYDIIIDGIFGTGLERDVEGDAAIIIDEINRDSNAIIYAMDLPSGLNADTGRVMGTAVKADVTFMFGTRKTGAYFGDSFDYCGERVLCKLPFPGYLMKQEKPVQLLSPEFKADGVSDTHHKKASHKYENGNVYIVGGSPGLTGAVIMAAKAAWSTGCGSVTVFTPEELSPAYDSHFMEIMRKRVTSDGIGVLDSFAADSIIKEIEKRPGVVVIGPGLGQSIGSAQLVKELLSKLTGVVVLDADGFTALRDEATMKAINPELRLIVTPHPGEQKTVFGSAPVSPAEARIMFEKLPCHKNSVGLFKGLPSQVISTEKTHVTAYDTRIFSRTGYGDVLAGLIAGRCSKAASLESVGAAWLHKQVCEAMIYSYKRVKHHPQPSPGVLL